MLKLFEKITAIIRQRVIDSIWARIAMVLSVVVVFCTTYALVLPALTLSNDSDDKVVQTTTVETSSEVSDSSIVEEVASSVKQSVPDEEQPPSSVEPTSKAQGTEVKSEASTQTTKKVGDEPQSTQTDSEDETVRKAGTFTKNTDGVTVKVTYPAETFTEKVSLNVIPVVNRSAIEKRISSELAKDNRTLITSYSYDISFINEAGVEVEPSKEVTVAMDFNADLAVKNKRQESWKLYHFIDDHYESVEDLTDDGTTVIKKTANGAVDGINFQSDTFSTYTIAGASYEDFGEYLTSGSYDTKPVYDEGTALLTTRIDLAYRIPADVIRTNPRYALQLPDDTTWTAVTEGQVFTGKDDSGQTDAYQYQFVQANGKKYMIITFLDDYIRNSGTTVSGGLKYTAEIGQSLRQQNNDYKIIYSDDVTVTIPGNDIQENPVQEEAQYDLSRNKTGKVVYNGDEAYLEYEVTVSSNKGTKDVVSLSDKLTASGLQLGNLEKTSIVKTTSNGGTQDVTNQIAARTSGTSFTMTIPKLGANEKYVIKYRYKVTGIPAGELTYVDNSLDVNTPDVPPQGTMKRTLSVTRNSVGKTGSYDANSNTITWRIEVNREHNDIADATLTDEMLKEALPGTLQISPNTGFTKVTDGYRFNATSNGKNTNSYVITYQTDAGKKASGWKEAAGVVRNEAILDDHGETTKGVGTAQTGSENTGSTSKKFVSEENTSDPNVKLLNWEARILVPGDGTVPRGAYFEDSLLGAGQVSADHYYTKAQLQAIYQQLENIFGKGNIAFTATSYGVNEYGNAIWGSPENIDQLSDDRHYYYYRFELLSDYHGNDVTIQYTSTANVKNISGFENTFDGHNVKHTYDAGHVTKMDASGGVGWQQNLGRNDYNPADTNYVIENGKKYAVDQWGNRSEQENSMVWGGRVDLESGSQSVTVTDTLPEGVDWKLLKLEFGRLYNLRTATISGDTISASGDGYQMNGTIKKGKITVTISTTDGSSLRANRAIFDDLAWNAAIYVRYTFETPKESPLDDDIVKSYTNHVSASVDGRPAGEDEQTQKTTYKPSQKVDKNGVWDNTSRELGYSIAINPDAQDLKAGSDVYTMTDELTYVKDTTNQISYDLKQSSVKLYDEKGNEVKDGWSWTVKKEESGLTVKSILTVNVPDETKYTLKYAYVVSREVDSEKDLTVTNTASIEGLKTGSDTEQTHFKWEKASTQGTAATDKKFQFTKVDASNFREVLPGATFAVYQNGVATPVATYTTDTNGNFNVFQNLTGAKTTQVSQLSENTLYYIEETEAPKGYIKSADEQRYYFYFSTDQSLPMNLIGFTGDIQTVVNLANQSKQEIVGNERLTSITVQKKWQTADGTDTVRSSGSIRVKLMRVSTLDQNPVVVETRDVKPSSGVWQTTFDQLRSKGSKSGEYYSYYVEEEPVNGYTATYVNDAGTRSSTASDVIATGENLTIINKADKQYALPKTGGSGIASILAVGLTLLGIVVMLFSLRVYKLYQGGGDL